MKTFSRMCQKITSFDWKITLRGILPFHADSKILCYSMGKFNHFRTMSTYTYMQLQKVHAGFVLDANNKEK